jgi:hypothetical protein
MTPAELKDRVLGKLRVLGAGQTAEAEDVFTVNEGYTSVYEQLKNQNLVTWSLTGDIPDKLATQIIKMVAYEVSDEFHIPEQRIQRLLIEADRALDDIRIKSAPEYVSTHTRVPYF